MPFATLEPRVQPPGDYTGTSNEPLAVFAKQARDSEWGNNPEDIRAVLDLAVIKEMHHE